jgi:hypothetical protein
MRMMMVTMMMMGRMIMTSMVGSILSHTPCIRSIEAGLEDVGLGVKILSRFCANTPKSGVVRRFKFFVGIKILGRAWDTPKIEES